MGYFKKIKQEVDADISREITVFDDSVYLVYIIDYRDDSTVGEETMSQVFLTRKKAQAYCDDNKKIFGKDVLFKIERVDVNTD